MIRRRDDGYEIDTATERLDAAQVHQWLSTDAYWAMGRDADVQAAAIAGSVCFGVYEPHGAQVGFARVVTDNATFGWVCDVYIARTARGLGLGTWLARTIRDEMITIRGLKRVVLATADAQGVYARADFAALRHPERWMEIDLRRVVHPGDVPHN